MLKEIIKNLFRNKITRIFLLFSFWVVLTAFYVVTFDTSFSIWSYNHPNSDVQNFNYYLFYKGETLKGQFIAQDNNLGIVAVRFQTYIRPPYQYEDQLLFKLKEKGAKTWYYQNTYRSGLVYDIPFFPFGFPQITNSKGKTYRFEITTLNTNAINKLSISNREPVLQSKYKYSGKELLHNKSEFIRFLIIKFSNAFKTPDVLFSSFIYLLPLFFYLVWIALAKMNLLFISKKLIYFLILIVLMDTSVMQLANDSIYIIIILLWIAMSILNKENGKKTFILSFFLILLCPLFLQLKFEPTAEKSGIWAFMFLTAGMIQILYELKMERPKLDSNPQKW